MCACVYVHVGVYMSVYVYVFVHVAICVYVSLCECMYMDVHVCICVNVSVCVCLSLDVLSWLQRMLSFSGSCLRLVPASSEGSRSQPCFPSRD